MRPRAGNRDINGAAAIHERETRRDVRAVLNCCYVAHEHRDIVRDALEPFPQFFDITTIELIRTI